VPDADRQHVRYGIEIPYGLSLLLYLDPRARVAGLDTVPRADWPPVAVVHLAFQVMVAAGFIMAGLAVWAAWRWWRGHGLEQETGLLRGLALASPIGFLAIEAGWIVTEVGRQPWIIYGVMRTSEAVTPMPGLWVPMITFTLLYGVLGLVVVWLLKRHIAAAAAMKEV
jgi:cytochrome d ubiquinol oxidase subunit I